ncbi:MAG: glycosyl transferase group 1 [Bacteroidetes bacterium]|nr:glycosyl transferase group 1 [Bacteroidota bacterium]
MKILIVCSATNRQIAPFIKEQAESLLACGEMVEFYLIREKGIKGYLHALSGLKSKISTFRPNIIHAHYGLSGLLANLQRKVPVVTTFHGSDINDPRVLKWSRWAIRLSRYAIFVSQQAVEIANPRSRYSVLPCGVNTNRFFPVNKKIARQQLGWNDGEVYILFAGTHEVEVKNYPLASQAVRNIPGAQLVELKGFDRDGVNLALNAADVALMTSFTEGSPQFIKEAMACNCPVVSTDVGDVKQLTEGVDGCYITSFEVESVTSGLQEALRFASNKGRTVGREKIQQLGLTDNRIAGELIRIYQRCVHDEAKKQ